VNGRTGGRRRFRDPFEQLVVDAELHVGPIAESWFITVPAYFDDTRRKAARRCRARSPARG